MTFLLPWNSWKERLCLLLIIVLPRPSIVPQHVINTYRVLWESEVWSQSQDGILRESRMCWREGGSWYQARQPQESHLGAVPASQPRGCRPRNDTAFWHSDSISSTYTFVISLNSLWLTVFILLLLVTKVSCGALSRPVQESLPISIQDLSAKLGSHLKGEARLFDGFRSWKQGLKPEQTTQGYSKLYIVHFFFRQEPQKAFVQRSSKFFKQDFTWINPNYFNKKFWMSTSNLF